MGTIMNVVEQTRVKLPSSGGRGFDESQMVWVAWREDLVWFIHTIAAHRFRLKQTCN